MKVLFIVTAYPRHDGDVITPWMGETIKRLEAAGTDVEVLAPSYRGSRTGVVDGVLVHRFRYAPARYETLTHDMPALDRIKSNPSFAALLPSYVAAGSSAAARVARDGKFDVVHVFWPIPHGLFGIAARRSSGAALVSTFFSSELNWRGAARALFEPILKRIVRNSDAITVISTYTGNRLREYAPEAESVTIPFGAAAVQRSHAAKSVRSRRNINDTFRLIFVGRLVKRKGVDVLLNAVARLATDRRLEVVIVGGGPEKESLIALAAKLGILEHVTFSGVLDSLAIDAAFRECDALVLPAIVTDTGETEGLGVVLIEAMGHGKPVIATSAGGIVDIVTDGETGLLAPPGDAAALASRIATAMNEPDELARIAERGAEFAQRVFGWNEIALRLNAVYDSAILKRTASGR